MPKGGHAKQSKPKDSSKGGRPVDYEATRQKPAVIPVDPLTPRPKLLAALAVVFAMWMAFLVYLYVKTIHPHRPGPPSSGPVAQASGGSIR